MKEIINKYKNKIFLFNSLKNKKELFIPINNNNINMYICGPTLYKNIHLGNCRTFIFFDILYRYFKHLNFKIKYIRNLTDINNNLQINLNNNYNYYNYLYNIKINYLKYNKILNIFNLILPNIEPRSTNYILEQINYIKYIIKLKYGYIKNGSVYFDINKYNKFLGYYGKILNNINIKNNKKLKNKFSIYKKKIFDFVLWKKNKNNIIKWSSPWSKGVPGWHIGCTTMSNKLLGDYFDIHGGGIDLKFPHHESEIILSNFINNNTNNLAKYWLHTNILTIKNKKMSKSLNNLILPYDIIKGKFKITNNNNINPFILKLYLIQTHYRKKISFSYKYLKTTTINYLNLLKIFKIIKLIKPKKNTSSSINIKQLYNECYTSINDDFNIPLLLSKFFYIKKILLKCLNNKLQITNKDLNYLKKLIKFFIIDILGLKIIKNKKKTNTNKTKKIIKNILKIREEMRKDKLYIYSDKLRNIINDYITINDNKIN
ncbi:MAG: cysteine--tRNA ligase [Candidatus Shikimatogenerans sp. JK-2022]|nr:cysteine--tRNA ligase [Candidatus Shikimatogenerans bostrichidophilus]